MLNPRAPDWCRAICAKSDATVYHRGGTQSNPGTTQRCNLPTRNHGGSVGRQDVMDAERGAGDEIRTRDILLGRQTLCQTELLPLVELDFNDSAKARNVREAFAVRENIRRKRPSRCGRRHNACAFREARAATTRQLHTRWEAGRLRLNSHADVFRPCGTAGERSMHPTAAFLKAAILRSSTLPSSNTANVADLV